MLLRSALFLIIAAFVFSLVYSCYSLTGVKSKYMAQSDDLQSTFNPSIAYDAQAGGSHVIFRVSNNSCGRKPKEVVNSAVMAFIPDADKGSIQDAVHFDFPTSVDAVVCSSSGVEDIRLFMDGDTLKGIGNYIGKTRGLPESTCRNKMAVLTFDKRTKLPVSSVDLWYPEGVGSNQKNWSPVEPLTNGDPIRFIYSWSPLVVLQQDPSAVEGQMMRVDIRNPGLPLPENARGGTQVVLARSSINPSVRGYTTIIHARELFGKNYKHMTIEMDTDLRVTKVSQPMCLGSDRSDPTLCGIEFASGLSVDRKGESTLTFGKDDCSSHIYNLSH